MRSFSFFKLLRADKITRPQPDPGEYIPAFWDDDYCQVEIVPVENKSFILNQAEQINNLSRQTKTEYGFTEIFVRGEIPFATLSKEIRIDYLERTLLHCEFQKAKKILVNGNRILDTSTGTTKAFGFSDFIIFFDTEEDFVKHIWIHSKHIVSTAQSNLIEEALYRLGEECGLILIDWNSLEFFDLADRTKIQKYLIGYSK